MVRFDAYKILIPYNIEKNLLGNYLKVFFVLDLFLFTDAVHVTSWRNEKLDTFD